ncbi:hypothetical protein RQP46_010236 [Phenoliferia psychrophenolica]
MSVADTSPPVSETLQSIIDKCPSEGFVVLGDTSNGGTVTAFERLGDKVFAATQGYGKGRPPHKIFGEGKEELLGVLLKAAADLGNETSYTWQAWDVPLPKDQNFPFKQYVGFIFSGKNGVVAPPPRRLR